MPFMAIYRRDDISAEQYDAFRAAVPLDSAPRGALAHAYGRTGPGFVSVDVWEDEAALHAFIRDVVAPRTEALGVEFHPPEIIRLETFVTTPGVQSFVIPFAPA
jgi:hypothetical protein